jgi:dephospho-CoA kinase
MLRIALTGGIATGKSYVLEQFRRRGVSCLDADVLAHGVTAPGTEASAAIGARFGPGILDADGAVDRTKLGRIVFGDSTARRDLEAIVHPAVYRAIQAGFRAFELLGAKLAVADIPLLYETGRSAEFDAVVVTICGREAQMERLKARGLSETEITQRLAAQMPTEVKASRADFVIRTDGPHEETDAQVGNVLAALSGRSTGISNRD